MRSTRSSFAVHHDRGHRASCVSTHDHHANGHVVVSNPSQLMAVNQQQHLQHQAAAQRRRSSIHASMMVQHAPVAQSHQAPVQEVEQLSPVSPQKIDHDVKVEITEVKP
jgi:hypothetical protein